MVNPYDDLSDTGEILYKKILKHSQGDLYSSLAVPSINKIMPRTLSLFLVPNII